MKWNQMPHEENKIIMIASSFYAKMVFTSQDKYEKH